MDASVGKVNCWLVKQPTKKPYLQNCTNCGEVDPASRKIASAEQVPSWPGQAWVVQLGPRYCDIDTQGNKALVMKQYLSDDQVAEIDEILEMKVTHRKNLERRKTKFG